MNSYMVKDVAIFFLIAVVSVALASFSKGVNEHLLLESTDQAALLSSLSINREEGTRPTDYGIFLKCFHQEIDATRCAQADFNGNGVVDTDDAGLLGALSRFDTNQDGVIVLQYPWEGVSDYEVFTTCWVSGNVSGECLSLDFNKDGVINNDDNELIEKTVRFDLNNNKRIEWR